MTTSGATSWTLTQARIIKRALRLLGVASSGETATAEEIADGTEALNGLVKAWQAKGIGQWARTEGSLTLVAGQQSYTMGGAGSPDFAVRPLRIESCRVRGSGSDIPMVRLSRQEYFDLPLKTSSGVPTQFYYDPQLGTGRLYVWPTLTAGDSRTLQFTYERTFEDFVAVGDTPDFPAEWMNALIYNLAVDLAPEYGKEPSSAVAARAQQYLNDLRPWDQEDSSIYFQPAQF